MNTETCHSNFNINLQYLFEHMLVYNKHLLFIVQGMNINVSQPYLKHTGSMT